MGQHWKQGPGHKTRTTRSDFNITYVVCLPHMGSLRNCRFLWHPRCDVFLPRLFYRRDEKHQKRTIKDQRKVHRLVFTEIIRPLLCPTVESQWRTLHTIKRKHSEMKNVKIRLFKICWQRCGTSESAGPPFASGWKCTTHAGLALFIMPWTR